jgi:prepilin-type processing-associated H-X9-DG protein
MLWVMVGVSLKIVPPSLLTYPACMSNPANRRPLHPAAVASFVLGLASVGFCLLALAGLPALWLGLRGLRAVNASDRELRGAGLAKIGMALGALGTAITLVGVCFLVALKLRDTSNRVESADNLRQIGVALHKYADTHESFPPATHDPRRLDPERRLSWMADLVPLLGEGTPRNKGYQELAKKIDRTRGWDDPANAAVLATPVRLFLCRGHPEYEPNGSPGLTHYVGVAGIDPGSAYLPRDHPRAGVFGHDRGVRRNEVTAGISVTMMVLETAARNGPWLAGGFPTVRGLGPDEEHYSGPGRPFGGLHARGVNVLFVDGSVRLRPDDTPGSAFRALATLRRWEEAPE